MRPEAFQIFKRGCGFGLEKMNFNNPIEAITLNAIEIVKKLY